jgi:hypothetical protein
MHGVWFGEGESVDLFRRTASLLTALAALPMGIALALKKIDSKEDSFVSSKRI